MKRTRSSPSLTTRRGGLRQALTAARRYWVGAVVLAGLGFSGHYVYHHSQELLHNLRLSWEVLAVAVVVQILFWFAVCYVWSLVLAKTTLARISISESFVQVALLNFGKYVPGKVWGTLARGVRLRQRHQVPSEEILGATYIEQYYLFLSAAIVCVLILAGLYPSPLTAAALVLCLGLVFFSPSIHRYLGDWAARLLRRLRRWMPIPAIDWKLGKLNRWENVLLFLGYAVIWLLSGLIFYLVYVALFSRDVGFHQLAVMVVANTVGIVAGFVAIFAPAGIGVREGASAAVLAIHMPIEEGLMLTVAFRVWVVVSELLAGLIVLVLLRSERERGLAR